ncbi:MAG: hypothetical protein AAFV27_04665 [Pseudomonadota bacterium]
MKEGEVDYLLKEYDLAWSYYVQTLAERKNVLEYYFKMIAIPGVLIIAFGDSFDAFADESDLSVVLVSLFVLLGVSGVGIFIYYALETRNSRVWRRKINEARLELRCHFKLHCESDEIRNGFDVLTFSRSSVVIVFNSVFFGFSAAISDEGAFLGHFSFTGAVIISIILHVVVFASQLMRDNDGGQSKPLKGTPLA